MRALHLVPEREIVYAMGSNMAIDQMLKRAREMIADPKASAREKQLAQYYRDVVTPAYDERK